jgi:DNA-binding winged helix-turn-helix (wHTH) protein/TolB-like protein
LPFAGHLIFMKSSVTCASSTDSLVQFREFTLNLRTRELWCAGEIVKLQRQPAILLAQLVLRHRELVTRAEIRELLWGDDTHVDYEQGINWCIRRIRQALGDNATSPTLVQTIAKQGYRFIGAVSSVGPTPDLKRHIPWLRRLQLATVALMIIVIGGSVRGRGDADRVLVLPLDNFSGVSSADALADARTDQLIAALGVAEPHRLGVIDRLTAAKFKHTGECIIKIGTQLKADYVFLGSLQQSPEGLRINGGLFRVSDNTQVWTTGQAGVSAVTDAGVSRITDSVVHALALASRQ